MTLVAAPSPLLFVYVPVTERRGVSLVVDAIESTDVGANVPSPTRPTESQVPPGKYEVDDACNPA